MKNVNARLMNMTRTHFLNKETGEITSTMTKILYFMEVDETEDFTGKGEFYAYAPEKAFTTLKKFTDTNELVKIDIGLRPNGNGVKYILQSVNGITVR